MDVPTHVAFFGASVTEQSVHHATQERTGFVNYFMDELAGTHGFKVSRVSAGSSDIMDAGIVYVEKILKLKPDICVLDWVTPSLMDCDPRIVQQVYYRLMEYDILPVTVLFPRTDRVQKDIPLAQEMARISREFDLPFFDVSDLLGDVGLETILRDTVHTNAAGARLYAEIILDILKQTQRPSGPLPRKVAPFHVMQALSSAKVPLASRRVQIDVENPKDRPVEFCLVLEQRVGPYSPILNVQVVTGSSDNRPEELEAYSIFDPWCHRERQCAKRITNWQNVDDLRQILLTVRDQTPGLVNQLDVEKMSPGERHLKPRGALYVIADRMLLCDVKWS